jgi:hypothetical protein
MIGIIVSILLAHSKNFPSGRATYAKKFRIPDSLSLVVFSFLLRIFAKPP